MRREIYCCLLVLLFVTACSPEVGDDPAGNELAENADRQPAYVGVTTCENCHAEQTDAWRGSHHELAMQPATTENVLADFDASEFTHQGVTSSFTKRGGQFFVTTVGPDGELAEFPVRYTFGVEPLQQYLLELPNGKLQALSLAWDTRDNEMGWFHVYGDEPIDHTDVLHWTRESQNWDTMCADCHSTGLVKRYDVETDRFDTSWTDINVACEACHGPGAKHVAWAEDGGSGEESGLTVALNERDDIAWILNPDTGNSARSQPRTTSREINTCAPCHSRRARIAAAETPDAEFLDAHLPALIQEPEYHADGQINDEVYVYGSFLQSRMHQQGVTCSDCHEPHTLTLRAPGAQVCAQCHNSEKYAATSHHQHAPESAGANCLDCHMLAKNYMQIDARRDHSFRIPRLKLSAELGTPEPCTQCHVDKDAAWAAEVWGAEDNSNHWTAQLAGESRGRAVISEPDTPDIIRATAIANLQIDVEAIDLLAQQVADPSALIRWTTARALQRTDSRTRTSLGLRLLADPVRAVRLEAAMALAPLGADVIPFDQQERLDAVLDEYTEAQRVNIERAEAHVNLGNLAIFRGRIEDAELSYRRALKINPDFVPAYANLADLFRSRAREDEAEAILREGLERLPRQGALHEALGLLLVRTERMAEAVLELSVAAESPDADARSALTYALALDAQGNTGAAIAYLQSARARFGDDQDLVAGLINLYQRTGNEAGLNELRSKKAR